MDGKGEGWEEQTLRDRVEGTEETEKTEGVFFV